MQFFLLKKVYFNNADDRNLERFTLKFLSSGLLWVYIALNPERKWGHIFTGLDKKDKSLFIKEYNKAFFFTKTYKELTRLFLGKKIVLKNLFLPPSAETSPEVLLKFNRSDDLRWKEALELIS